jgi:hypothetical protein
MQAADRLMDRGFGRPPVTVEMDQREVAVKRLEVRWLPPDPNDTSHYIPPEPD